MLTADQEHRERDFFFFADGTALTVTLTLGQPRQATTATVKGDVVLRCVM